MVPRRTKSPSTVLRVVVMLRRYGRTAGFGTSCSESTTFGQELKCRNRLDFFDFFAHYELIVVSTCRTEQSQRVKRDHVTLISNSHTTSVNVSFRCYDQHASTSVIQLYTILLRSTYSDGSPTVMIIILTIIVAVLIIITLSAPHHYY